MMTWSKVVEKGFGDYQNHALGYMGTFNAKLMAITTLTHDGFFGDTERYLDGIEVWQSSTGNLGNSGKNGRTMSLLVQNSRKPRNLWLLLNSLLGSDIMQVQCASFAMKLEEFSLVSAQ